MNVELFIERNASWYYSGPLVPILEYAAQRGQDVRVSADPTNGSYRAAIIDRLTRDEKCAGIGPTHETALRTALGIWPGPHDAEKLSAALDAITKERAERVVTFDEVIEMLGDNVRVAFKRLEAINGTPLSECDFRTGTLDLAEVDDEYTPADWLAKHGTDAWAQVMDLIEDLHSGKDTTPIIVTGRPRTGYQVVWGDELVVAHAAVGRATINALVVR